MPDAKPRKLTFESTDGFVLKGEWHPGYVENADPPYVVIISPGMGVPARFYRPFARHLVGHGMDVLLFDFRGIGWSGVSRLSGFEADASTWGRMDLAAAIDQALIISGGKQAVGIGHSFGGSIFGFTENIGELHKMVHICSQSGYYGFYDWRTRLFMLFNIHLAMPLLTRVLGYYPAHWLSGSEALPAGFVAEWSSWCLRKNYFMDERFAIRDSAHHADFHGPLLSLSFDDDAWATRESVDAMASFYPNGQLDRRHLHTQDYTKAGFGHFDVFKPAIGRGVWNLIAKWVKAG